MQPVTDASRGDAGRVTSGDGTAIAYTRSGTGPALVLVDPALGFRSFGPNPPIAEALSAAFTVFAYDRRGRGESADTAPYAVAREVEDLAAILGIAGGAACVFGYSSGAVLALHAALAGVPMHRMALFEPPLGFPDDPEPKSDLGAEIESLVRAGRRDDAILHFTRSIGVPESMLTEFRSAPVWPELEKLAHTLAYDAAVARAATALPSSTHHSLDGGWHGADPAAVAAAVSDYCAAGTK